MYQGHFLGHIVRELRQRRLNGASSYALMAYLQPFFPDARAMAARYLNYAFFGSGLRLIGVLRMGQWSDYSADSEIWSLADALIDKAQSTWCSAPIPELMRIRDYGVFLDFARAEDVRLLVCSANPSAGRWIGASNARCYSGRWFVPSVDSGSDAGLLAADPADARLREALAAYGELSYAEYARLLAESGAHVLGSDAGYALVDDAGRRFYEGYRLHGVYDAKTSEPVWTARRGEALRAALNRALGEDLVHGGPHDDWEHRNNSKLAGPWRGPQLPLIEFTAEGRIQNLLSQAELSRLQPYESRWAELYPVEPSERS